MRYLIYIAALETTKRVQRPINYVHKLSTHLIKTMVVELYSEKMHMNV